MTRSQRLWIAFGLNLALVAGQVVFGLAANSLGLLADAGHNLTDVAALIIALSRSASASARRRPRIRTATTAPRSSLRS